MLGGSQFRQFVVLVACISLIQANSQPAEVVAVRHLEGLSNGFLALRTMEGKLLADGEITQVANDDHVTSRVFFRFKDGSMYDDTAIFSQRGGFRLLSDHLIEKGPSFKHPTETTLDASTGQVMVRYTG